MAPTSTALTTKVDQGSPYQINKDQTLKASKALVGHIKSETKRLQADSTKRNLLAGDDGSDDGVNDEDDVPIWLVLTTKKHIIDAKRLKPSKIALPHPLLTSPTATICLITADPQRTFKDVIADPSFPPALAKRITRVIGVSKLRLKYKSYESKRQLREEYDIFLADDRIVTLLPNILGKIFYQATAKRPLPINIAPQGKDRKERKVKKEKDEPKGAASPQQIAKEIERTLSAALVHLSPSVTTSIRVGKASWEPEMVAENVEAVANGVIEKFVPHKWRNVKSIHIKGPNTMALPIWLAEELWSNSADVLEDAADQPQIDTSSETKQIEQPKETEKKRKGGSGEEKSRKKRKSQGDDLAAEIALRKEKIKKQKAEAMQDVEA